MMIFQTQTETYSGTTRKDQANANSHNTSSLRDLAIFTPPTTRLLHEPWTWKIYTHKIYRGARSDRALWRVTSLNGQDCVVHLGTEANETQQGHSLQPNHDLSFVP